MFHLTSAGKEEYFEMLNLLLIFMVYTINNVEEELGVTISANKTELKVVNTVGGKVILSLKGHKIQEVGECN